MNISFWRLAAVSNNEADLWRVLRRQRSKQRQRLSKQRPWWAELLPVNIAYTATCLHTRARRMNTQTCM